MFSKIFCYFVYVVKIILQIVFIHLSSKKIICEKFDKYVSFRLIIQMFFLSYLIFNVWVNQMQQGIDLIFAPMLL